MILELNSSVATVGAGLPPKKTLAVLLVAEDPLLSLLEAWEADEIVQTDPSYSSAEFTGELAFPVVIAFVCVPEVAL